MDTNPWQSAVKIGIVNARNTDRYALIYVYADGSETGETGSYQTFDAAYAVAEGTPGAVIEDWTRDEETP